MKTAAVSIQTVAATGRLSMSARELMGDTHHLDAKISSHLKKIHQLQREVNAMKRERQRVLDTAAVLEAKGFVKPITPEKER